MNMNVPRELGRKLANEGHEYRHAAEAGMSKTSDVEVMERASANSEIIITHDLDYGHLLAFSGDKAPSVIILRLHNSHAENVFTKLTGLFPAIEKPLLEGAIVILEDSAHRIRKLPVGDTW